VLQVTELGNRLKEARIAKGLSLDDLQSMTKIQKRYLIGIEEGNHASMPGNFYVRAFIKQYAEALNINPDEIFEAYKNEIPASYHKDLPQQLSRVKTNKTIPQGNSKIFDVLPKILIAIFVIGVAFLVYYLVSNNAGSNAKEPISSGNEPVKIETNGNLEKANSDKKEIDKQKDSEKEQEKTGQEVEKTPVVEVPKQELTVVQTSGRKTTYALKNSDKFVVKLISRGQSWVSIKNGKGNSFFQGTLVAGTAESQTVDLSAESEAVIVVGRSVDTDIYVNDQKIEYAVAPTEMVRQDITIQFVPKTE
jgi:cytoskeletal protein RodZ